MKKILKITLSTIGAIFLCLMIFGHVAKIIMRPSIEMASERTKFAQMISRVDNDCPIPTSMGKGAVTGVKLINGYVTYYISYEPDFFNILSSLNNDEKVKEGLMMCFLCVNAQGSNNGDIFMNALEKFDYGVRLVITESATGRFDISATAQEIKTLREKYKLNPHEALFNLLSLSLEADRATLPLDLEDGFVLVDYSLDDENIVVSIQLDENLYSMEEMSSNIELVKEAMFEEGLKDPSSKTLLDMCKVSHSGLKYIFIGNRTHKTIEVELSSNEIRRIVPTPEMLNIQ